MSMYKEGIYTRHNSVHSETAQDQPSRGEHIGVV